VNPAEPVSKIFFKSIYFLQPKADCFLPQKRQNLPAGRQGTQKDSRRLIIFSQSRGGAKFTQRKIKIYN